MTSINSSSSSQYYTLTGQQSNTGTTGQSTAASAYNTLQQILSGQSTNSSSGDIVDLSPAAQSYLSNINASGSGTQDYLSAAGGDTQSTNFILSNSQRQKLNDILAKYKDAPFNQDTYNQIQDDLTQAGLAPSQLSQLDKVNSFNPTQVFLNIINGKQTDITSGADSSGTSDSAEQTKSNNYMQQILQQWKSISSTASAADTTATSNNG